MRYLTTLFYFPYYLLGRFEQKQTVSLTLKENYVDNAVNLYFALVKKNKNLFSIKLIKYMPAHKIIIKIHGKLQYYSAFLVIEAKFTGLKYQNFCDLKFGGLIFNFNN